MKFGKHYFCMILYRVKSDDSSNKRKRNALIITNSHWIYFHFDFLSFEFRSLFNLKKHTSGYRLQKDSRKARNLSAEKLEKLEIQISQMDQKLDPRVRTVLYRNRIVVAGNGRRLMKSKKSLNFKFCPG